MTIHHLFTLLHCFLQGHNYEVILRSLSSDVSINGTDSAPVIIGSSQAEFTGLSINKVGLHAIEVYIQSTPDDYSNRAQVLLQVVDNQHVSPVIEATHLVQIKFDADYDLIFQKEMEFAVELYEALELPMSVDARNFTFAEGKIEIHSRINMIDDQILFSRHPFRI